MSTKNQPDIEDTAVFDGVTEDPADVEPDTDASLPSEADAPDLYKPPAP